MEIEKKKKNEISWPVILLSFDGEPASRSYT